MKIFIGILLIGSAIALFIYIYKNKGRSEIKN